jgi:Bacterial SH3 domain
MPVDDESEELEPSADAVVAPEVAPEPAAAPEPAPEPAPATRNPRQVRARRRRRRRQFGTLLFIVVAVGVVAAAYFTLAGDESSKNRASASTSLAPTTVAPPFSGTYKATTGLNVRQGPGTTVPTVGVVETGRDVTVTCVVEGELVNAPSGPNSQWLKITGPGPVGYVSSAFVAVGDDLRTQKIPTCPPA